MRLVIFQKRGNQIEHLLTYDGLAAPGILNSVDRIFHLMAELLPVVNRVEEIVARPTGKGG